MSADDGVSDERHNLQPTYQGNLQLAIRNIIISFSKGDYIGAFGNCETLYVLLPDLWEELDKEIYADANKRLVDAIETVNASDIHAKRAIRYTDVKRIKSRFAFPFFKVLIKSMKIHKYLDYGWTPLSEGDFRKLEEKEEAEE